MMSARQRVFQGIRADRRSGASALLADALEAGRLFLGAARPARAQFAAGVPRS
jgi:hypothetical protein